MRLNPYYVPTVHYALWLDCLRQQNYQQAYLETTGIVRSSIFWHPLVKASSLGLLGRYDKGQEYVGKLLELRPDFSSCGRMLIGRYIKNEELEKTVIEGLEKVGLDIE